MKKNIQKLLRESRSMCKNLAIANRKLSLELDKLKKLNNRNFTLKEIIKTKYKKAKGKLSTIKDELRHFIMINDKINSNSNLRTLSSLVARLSSKIMHTDVSILRFLDTKNNRLQYTSLRRGK